MTADDSAPRFDALPQELQDDVLSASTALSQKIAAVDPNLVLSLMIGTHPDHTVAGPDATQARESIVGERWSAKIWPKVDFMKVHQRIQ